MAYLAPSSPVEFLNPPGKSVSVPGLIVPFSNTSSYSVGKLEPNAGVGAGIIHNSNLTSEAFERLLVGSPVTPQFGCITLLIA